MKMSRFTLSNQEVHTTVAAMFFSENKDSILMIEKSDPAYGKKYSIVAGHVESCEEIEDAFKREIKEELNLEGVNYHLMASFKELSDSCRYGAHIHDWHVFSVDFIPDINSQFFDAEEISSFKWMNRKDLPSFSGNLTSGAKSLFSALGWI